MSDEVRLLEPAELEALGFEGAQAKLEEVTERLESGTVALSEALGLYRLGVQLRDWCRSLLEAAEAQLERLVESGDGELAIEERADGL